jgi:hypothetical protein
LILTRSAHVVQTSDARLKRLAAQIEALTEKDEKLKRHTQEILALRLAAARELWTICAGFVGSLNGLLERDVVVLDPDTFTADTFQESGPNLLQINVRGRILQVEFQATGELTSTEDFRIPYTLAGSVRAFNQALLDKDLIEEQLLFCTMERETGMWRFFDPRTYRSGPFDASYLTSLMEQIV